MMSDQMRASFLFCVILMWPFVADAADQWFDLRRDMVSEFVEAEGVTDERVLQSMRSVPRHEFCLPKFKTQAYQDTALPIGSRQTISPPFVVAYMTEVIDPQETDRVLEIGTGSGYQAAILAGLVKDVYTIEIVEALGRTAAKRLADLGYDNVHCRIGDGYKGWPDLAPFDKIIVTCSPESVPRPLVEQLKEGGRMVIPLGQRYQQVFHLFQKRDGKLIQEKLIPTLFVPMTGISEDNRKVRPNPLRPVIVNGGFEDDENADEKPDHWHYQRQITIVDDESREGKKCLNLTNKDPGRLSQLLQGAAVDGRRVGRVRISLWFRHEGIRPGPGRYEQAAVLVHFYDMNRKSIETFVIGPWRGSIGWQKVTREIAVPRAAKEMIVRIGLNGATGSLWVDDLRMTSRAK
jgi:protein-L-isoaspartate(D-aspartate) O-methyltransferase